MLIVKLKVCHIKDFKATLITNNAIRLHKNNNMLKSYKFEQLVFEGLQQKIKHLTL